MDKNWGEKVLNLVKEHDSIPMVYYYAVGGISISWISYKLYQAIYGGKTIKRVELNRSDRELLHDKFVISKVPDEVDVIVIGSGMSGLTCATILSRLGNRVLVLEQHDDVCGGGTHMFEEKGYRFDSGLHYTVPWSVPIFALTCLKKSKDCLPFDLMDEGDGTADKIYLTNVEKPDEKVEPFRIKYKETHFKELYTQFPDEKVAIDRFVQISNDAMNYVKVYLFSRLLPKRWQPYFWKLIPKRITDTAAGTALDILPTLTSNKRLISLLSSMWIDTGARPDKATFMLTASVFRGLALEGACYPRGGSDTMAKQLVPIIESYGGRVLIRAPVSKILLENGHTSGVRLRNGVEIKCKKAVVSSAGYEMTAKLLEPVVRERYDFPLNLSKVSMSAGFIMCNIGMKASHETIGVTNTNTWHIPVDPEGDAFPLIKDFFENHVDAKDIPVFITFPSTKDVDWIKKNPEKTCCQMLIMAEYSWFESFVGPAPEETIKVGAKKPKVPRLEGYEALKEAWKRRCLDIFLRYFPLAKEHIDYFDISTPISIEQWLNASRGGAVGLDVTPVRFCDPDVQRRLDPVTQIPGLYMTGQDTAICGVTLCQLTGVITALRMEGLFAGIKILMQSILLGN